MFRDGEIIKLTCPQCEEVNKFKWHNKENFGRDTKINEIPGETGSDIKCKRCGQKL